MIDEPLSDQEIVRQAARNTVADWRTAYAKHKRARETGGPCEVCGWRDGDGVKTCFYSPELGAVTHQNSLAGAMKTMTAEQRSLLESYSSAAVGVGVIDEASAALVRERLRQHVREEVFGTGQYAIAYWRIGAMLIPKDRAPDAEAAVERYLRSTAVHGVDRPTLEEARAQGYVIVGQHTRTLAGLTLMAYDVQKPHSCGGFGIRRGPYHIACTRCGTEVRLWEHGIDYDIG